MRNGTFSVCASNMDGCERLMRVPEQPAEEDGVVQIRLVGSSSYPVKHGKLAVKVLECLVISWQSGMVQTLIHFDEDVGNRSCL